jgi:hypothetical protein
MPLPRHRGASLLNKTPKKLSFQSAQSSDKNL